MITTHKYLLENKMKMWVLLSFVNSQNKVTDKEISKYDSVIG